jgi:hypothetical protein
MAGRERREEDSIVKERQAACSGQLTVVSGQLQSRQEAHTPRLHDSVPVYMLASGFSATREDFLTLALVSSLAMGKSKGRISPFLPANVGRFRDRIRPRVISSLLS